MNIMDGVKLGIGLYIAKNIGYFCDGLCIGIYKGVKDTEICKKYIEPYIKETNDEKSDI